MADRDFKLMHTPVSVNDGFKRADGRTWAILLAGLAVAIVGAVLVNLYVEKTPVHWPSSPTQPPAAAAQPAVDGPRTFEVAPPGSVPPPNGK